MAIPSISDRQSNRKPASSELYKTILAKVQKGYKLLLKKIKSAFPVRMHIDLHIMSFITTKFQEIMLSGFRGVALTNCCFSSIFHFGQIFKFKKSVTPRKKKESKFPVDECWYTLFPSLLQSFTKFC